MKIRLGKMETENFHFSTIFTPCQSGEKNQKALKKKNNYSNYDTYFIENFHLLNGQFYQNEVFCIFIYRYVIE